MALERREPSFPLSHMFQVPCKETHAKPVSCWSPQGSPSNPEGKVWSRGPTFHTAEDLPDPLRLIPVWPAAWSDFQHIVRAVFREELPGRGKVRLKGKGEESWRPHLPSLHPNKHCRCSTRRGKPFPRSQPGVACACPAAPGPPTAFSLHSHLDQQ